MVARLSELLRGLRGPATSMHERRVTPWLCATLPNKPLEPASAAAALAAQGQRRWAESLLSRVSTAAPSRAHLCHRANASSADDAGASRRHLLPGRACVEQSHGLVGRPSPARHPALRWSLRGAVRAGRLQLGSHGGSRRCCATCHRSPSGQARPIDGLHHGCCMCLVDAHGVRPDLRLCMIRPTRPCRPTSAAAALAVDGHRRYAGEPLR